MGQPEGTHLTLPSRPGPVAQGLGLGTLKCPGLCRLPWGPSGALCPLPQPFVPVRPGPQGAWGGLCIWAAAWGPGPPSVGLVRSRRWAFVSSTAEANDPLTTYIPGHVCVPQTVKQPPAHQPAAQPSSASFPSEVQREEPTPSPGDFLERWSQAAGPCLRPPLGCAHEASVESCRPLPLLPESLHSSGPACAGRGQRGSYF